MAALDIQTVILSHGINQLAVIVPKMGTSLLKRRLRAESKLSVQMVITKKKFKSKIIDILLLIFTESLLKMLPKSAIVRLEAFLYT